MLNLAFSKTDIISIVLIAVIVLLFSIVLYVYTSSLKKELDTNKRDIELIDKLIEDNKPKNIKKRKIFRTVKNVLFYLLLIIMIPTILYSLYSRIKGNTPTFGNKIVMVVGSDSMSYKNQVNQYLFDENTKNKDYQIQVGDIILIDKIKDDYEIEKYDIVCYYNSKLKENIIHRVVSINSNGSYTAQGDAVPESDGYNLHRSDILGIYSGKKIPAVGNFILFLQSMIGLSSIIGGIILLLVIDLFLSSLSKKEKEKKEKFNQIIDYQNKDIKELKIYYLNYCYEFNNNEFVQKEEIKEEDLRIKSSSVLIKRIEFNSNEIKEEEIEIN